MQDSGNIPISISDKALLKFDPFDGLKLLKDHGFTHIHFSHRWTANDPLTDSEVARWQEVLQDTGIAVLDVHGCHPGNGAHLWADDPELRADALKMFRHRLEVTHRLGGDAMVYHVPTRVEPNDEVIGRYVDGLARMEEDARRLGIVVALENHFVAENDKRALSACFERFDKDYIGLTLDTGHGNVSGNLDWVLANCMDRLTILHLNDNDAKSDRHWVPREAGGTVDWTAVIASMAKSPYTKPIQLEVSWSATIDPEHSTFLEKSAAAARWIHDEVQKAREDSGSAADAS